MKYTICEEIAIGVASLAWSGIYCLSQIDTIIENTGPLSGGIMGLLSQFGGVGLAVWLVIHHTTKVIPTMQKEFREERESLQTHHTAAIELLTGRHIKEMENRREDFKQMLEQVSCKYFKGS
jgi:hypothetical protein